MEEDTHQAHQFHSRTVHVCKLHSMLIWSLLLLAAIFPASCVGQCTTDSGCFPPLGNLALDRVITASSTCEAGSQFCVFLFPSDCRSCDPTGQHSASSINDNDTSSFWVSQVNVSSEVSLQLDFEAPVFFENMTMTWESQRPDAMVLERSHDNGVSWLPYRYYSPSCALFFMLPDTFVGPSTVFGSTEPICTSTQSQLAFGSEPKEMTFSTAQHLQASASAEQVVEYAIITNLRVRFLAVLIELDLSGPMFRYYALSEWQVLGTCVCNGHASICAPGIGEQLGPNKVYTGCACEHHTAGQQCDQCAVGFNNLPWAPGTQQDANACQMCMCNGFAPDCQFDAMLQSSVCLGCSANTAGDQCNECLPGYYQNTTLLLNDPDICVDCGCDLAGSTSELCDGQGQCSCRENVDPASLSCSQCEDGYWNLTESNMQGCQVCDCDPAGSVLTLSGLALCDKDTGDCLCRENTEGERCDRCQPEFFDLSSGCVPCGCNLGGSASLVCDQSSPTAQCLCKDNVDTTTCTAPFPGFYFRFLDHIVFEAEAAALSQEVQVILPLPESSQRFTGRGLVSLPSFSSASFTLDAPQDSQYELILRYQTTLPIDISLTLFSQSEVDFDLHCVAGSGNVSRFYFVTLPPTARAFTVESVCLSSAVPYTLLLEYNSFSSNDWLLDSVLLLPDFSAVSVFYDSQSLQDQLTITEPCLPREAPSLPPPFVCQDVSFTLSTEFFGVVYPCECDPDGTESGVVCSFFGGQCAPCRPGVTGLFCDSCTNGNFNLTSDGCQACECHPEGSTGPVCDLDSGQCQCQPGVGGQSCSQCLPGFFNLTSAGCQPCECSEFSEGMSCNAVGQCSCPDGVDGLLCDRCMREFYNISSAGCLPCNCDPFGAPSGECDDTGQCECIQNTEGLDCSACPTAHFATDGLSRDLCEECVCLGRSELCVADTGSSALGAVQSNFSALCAESAGDCADGWMLFTSAGQVAAPYGLSDVSGLGYILLANDLPMFYAPQHFLGNWIASYGLDFTVTVGLSNSGTLNNNTVVRITGSLLSESLVGLFDFSSIPNGFAFDRTVTYTIPFAAERWRVGSLNGPQSTVLQLLSVLSNVTELSFTAQYTDDLIEFNRIQTISLLTAVTVAEANSTALTIAEANSTARRIVTLAASFPVEDCLCPQAYTGPSCQDCATGYARLSGNVLDDCVLCDCNEQTFECNVSTGVCINCGSNSEGSNCERCRPGYYGDPTRGIPCLPCLCPRAENSFSPSCFLDTDGLPTCDSCQAGYTGRSCELCDEGFFGSPLVGRCTTCECNGNVEPALGAVCDTATGQCLNCLNNTEGFECELCQSGFFGDPALDIPCQECPCNPSGVEADCDRLSGMCVCLPNVVGPTCSQCEDGYWGLSQSLGCIPCDCCNDNTVDSGICNQDTGRCSCIPNVGSAEDDKCCNCTGSFFNLTEDGCEPCNCSSLSVSGECDMFTGECQCQVGAIGLKCDDCAFGFTGRVPDCEPCHECYFQWFDIITDTALRISSLRQEVELLLSTYYNGHNISSIESAFAGLLLQLDSANSTLNSIALNVTSLDSLEGSLQQFEETLLELDRQVSIIESQLVLTQIMLDTVNSFDGSVNMTTILELHSELLQHNATVAILWAAANTSLQLLEQDLATVQQAWTEIIALNASLEDVLAELPTSESFLQMANDTIQQYQADFDLLRMNLTSLDNQARYLIQLLSGTEQSVANASIDTSSLNVSVADLTADIDQSQLDAQAILLLAQQLNTSVTASRQAAQSALETTDRLQMLGGALLEDVNSTFEGIDSVAQTIADSMQELVLAKATAQQVLNLSLPPVAYVQELAEQINETILPDSVVEEIINNAATSKLAAESALATAENISVSVSDTEESIAELFEALEQANETLQNVEEAIPGVELRILATSDGLSEIEDADPEVERIGAAAEAAFSSANSTVYRAQALGMQNRQRAIELLLQSTTEASTAQSLQQRVQQTLINAGNLSCSINSTFEEAVSTANTVSALETDVNELFRNVTRVSLEDLDNLWQEYVEERRVAGQLSEEIGQLHTELTELTDTFIAASQRLQQCYETP